MQIDCESHLDIIHSNQRERDSTPPAVTYVTADITFPAGRIMSSSLEQNVGDCRDNGWYSSIIQYDYNRASLQSVNKNKKNTLHSLD